MCKKILSFLFLFLILFSLTSCSETPSFNNGENNNPKPKESVKILACSDFQATSGNIAGVSIVQEIIDAMVEDGVEYADGFLSCGDYDYEYVDTLGGIDSLKMAVSDLVTEEMVFIQGNHDTEIATDGISFSGNNDPISGEYGVFVINEDDYMWYNNDLERIKQTTQNLINYLNKKLAEKYDRPIFVLSHLPLHYCLRTLKDGDGMYAKYLFDVLNEAGEKGLNIVFMYGHNHSHGWDDYLGGACVYLPKGDQMLIANNAKDSYSSHTLNFTYINPGYTGYYGNVNNGVDDTLSMTYYEITDDSLTVTRYNNEGRYNLKAKGVKNSNASIEYNNPSLVESYQPNTDIYEAQQVIELSEVIDSTPISNIITPKDTYQKVSSYNQLESGEEYLLVYSVALLEDFIVKPLSVTKANNEGSQRIGLDLERSTLISKLSGTSCTFNVNIYEDYSSYLWELEETDDGWYLSSKNSYAKLNATTNNGIALTLESMGDIFTITESNGTFTFSTGSYVLNYNDRGLINGYSNNPASFHIYKKLTA